MLSTVYGICVIIYEHSLHSTDCFHNLFAALVSGLKCKTKETTQHALADEHPLV